MPIPQGIKDVLEVSNNLIIIGTILSVSVGWYITRQKRVDAGKKAVNQIDKMATNDIPHLTAACQETNTLLVAQTLILTSIDKGIAVLVDRKEI